MFRHIACLFLLTASLTAHAANVTSYLSQAGSDANACDRANPCRFLPAALAATNIGGEVVILDSANFNIATVTINQAVTVRAAPGVAASLQGIGGTDALDITAAVPVTVRNLTFRDTSTDPFRASVGIRTTAAATLIVDGVTIKDFWRGLEFAVTGNLVLTDSMFTGNLNSAVLGDTGTTVKMLIRRCTFVGGEMIYSQGGNLVVRDSSMTNGSFGLYTQLNANVTLDGNTIANNTTGVYLYGAAVVQSTGNNQFSNNSTNVLGGVLTAQAKQ